MPRHDAASLILPDIAMEQPVAPQSNGSGGSNEAGNLLSMQNESYEISNSKIFWKGFNDLIGRGRRRNDRGFIQGSK